MHIKSNESSVSETRKEDSDSQFPMIYNLHHDSLQSTKPEKKKIKSEEVLDNNMELIRSPNEELKKEESPEKEEKLKFERSESKPVKFRNWL